MAKLNDLIVTGDTKMLGKLHANADTATTASSIFDSGNKSLITLNYSASGISNPAWLAGWNGYELRGVSRTALTVGYASLLALNSTLTTTSTRSVGVSSWNGGIGSGLNYMWGQSFKDTSIGSDTGDIVLAVRAGQYTSGSTELCVMIDGDYYSMGNKVLHAGNYKSYALPRDGSVGMTGVLHLKPEQYTDSITAGALNANNSNIYGVNSIYTADLADSASEGIHFYRTSTTVDSLWGKNGVLYFSPNRTVGSGSSTDYTILHTGNYKTYALARDGSNTMTGTLKIGTSSTTTSPGIGILVHDLRDATINPGTFGNNQVNFYFDQVSDGFAGTTTTKWMSIMHIKGWTGSYSAWELAGNADNSSADDTLRYRQGKDTTWGAWQSVLTDANFTTYLNSTYVNATGDTMTGPIRFNYGNTTKAIFSVDDGTSGQYGFRLQYNGAGTGNDNALVLIADNQEGTEVNAITMLQDGTTTFATNITALANANINTIDTTRIYSTSGIGADGTILLVPQYNNEVNFGGSNNASTIYFGYRATGSKPIPTKFVFGSSTGTATLTAAKLELTSTQDVGVNAYNSPALTIGASTGEHIEFDTNEIMAKANASTATTLYLNADGGLVQVGGGGLATSGNIGAAGTITANSYIKATTMRMEPYTISDNKTKNWYRVWNGSGSNTGNCYCIITISRSYNSPQNESYTFAINVGYNGDINVTQLSGVKGSPLITKIRVVYKNSGNVYVDFYANANASYSNTYYVSGYGYGTFQAPSIVSATVESGYVAYEFVPTSGVKSSGPISGSRIFAGYDSGENNSVSCSNWFRSNGDTGWYNATHGCHVRPNTISSYGGVRIHGNARNGYEGLHFGSGTNGITIMNIDGSHQGLYNEAASRWIIYYPGSGGCVGVGTSGLNSSYNVTMGSTYIGGALYATGLIYSASSSKTLMIGSQNTSYCHYTTDASVGHWFNKNTYVQGDIYAGASYDQKVLHAGNYSSYALPLSGGTMTGNITLGTYGMLGFGNTIPATHKEVTSFTPEANAVWLATTGGGGESAGICLDGATIRFWTPNDSTIEFLDSDTAAGTTYASVKMGVLALTSALSVSYGGTGMTSNPSMLVNLGSTSAASVFAASPRPGITGTLGVANGGTGVTSWTTNRLIYASGATTFSTSSHYISNSTVCINGTNTDYTFYVNGNSFCNGTITFNSDSHGLRTLRNNYTNIGEDGTAFFWGYINNLKGTGSCTYSSFNATSDARLKTNFRSVSFGDIFDLPIYKFDFIAGETNKIGCMAQDLQQICPEIVHQGEDGYLSIEESKIVYLLLDKMKEMQKEINELKEGK